MKKVISMIFIILPVLFTASCSSSEFSEAYSEYRSLYISSMDFVNDGSFANKENVKKLQKVDLDVLEANINSLKELEDQMNDLAKTDYEKNIIRLIIADRIDLDTVLDIRKRIDTISDDDVWDLSYAFTIISSNVKEYKKSE